MKLSCASWSRSGENRTERTGRARRGKQSQNREEVAEGLWLWRRGPVGQPVEIKKEKSLHWRGGEEWIIIKLSSSGPRAVLALLQRGVSSKKTQSLIITNYQFICKLRIFVSSSLRPSVYFLKCDSHRHCRGSGTKALSVVDTPSHHNEPSVA